MKINIDVVVRGAAKEILYAKKIGETGVRCLSHHMRSTTRKMALLNSLFAQRRAIDKHLWWKCEANFVDLVVGLYFRVCGLNSRMV